MHKYITLTFVYSFKVQVNKSLHISPSGQQKGCFYWFDGALLEETGGPRENH